MTAPSFRMYRRKAEENRSGRVAGGSNRGPMGRLGLYPLIRAVQRVLAT
jgi:hypothetical protein